MTLPFRQRIYEMLMESQYWPPAQMLEYQRSQLTQLLKHAKANVPFYQSRLDCVFKANGEIDWKRWNEIPIVRRQNLVDDRENMLATQLPAGHGATWDTYSSGSAGKPITVRHNLLEGWVSHGGLYRSERWHDVDWSRPFLSWQGDDNMVSNWPNGDERESWGPDWLATEQLGKAYNLNRATPQENVIEFMRRKKVPYFASRPKLVQSLALASKRAKIPVKLDVVITFGTGATEDERNDFAHILGAKTLSIYSSGEGCKMACTCETGLHYHISEELVFLEVLDGDGRPCEIGQPGRVIITPMFNTTQPLVRYETGDIAIRGQSCSCGKQLPVLQEISGRITDLFRFPDGQIVSPSLPAKDFCTNFGSKTWQLVQTGPLEVELRYVITDPDVTPNRAYAIDAIHRRIRPDLSVKFVVLSETPITPAGKFIQYKSELINSMA